MALVLTACTSTPTSAPTSTGVGSPEPRAYQPLAITSDLVPAPRDFSGMVYFPPRAEVVLFGGADENGRTVADTWAFDQHGWRELHPATSPSARAGFAMAYDPALRQIVLYGGCTSCGAPGYHLVQDTWAFNGTTWHQLTSARLPTYEPTPLLSWDTATKALELLAPPPAMGPTLRTVTSIRTEEPWVGGPGERRDGHGMAHPQDHRSSSRALRSFLSPDRQRCSTTPTRRIPVVARAAGDAGPTRPVCCTRRPGHGMAMRSHD